MNIKSADAFVERMKDDEDFAKQVIACKDTEQRMAMVESEGFKFTQEEIQELKEKLTDDDLIMLAGGYWHGEWHPRPRSCFCLKVR